MRPNEVLTILFVSELEVGRRFFDEVFGWSKTVDVPVYVEYDLGAARLGLMPQRNTRHFLGDELGLRTFTDGCPRAELYLSFEDAQPVVDRLLALQVECVSPLAARDWGDRTAYFRIMDGYILAVAERIPA